MSDQKRITDAELAEIKLLQTKFQETILKLGNLQVEKMELDRRVNEFLETEKSLKEAWINLQTMEKGLLDKIIKTYGEINLNIVDGTFTSTDK